MDYQDFCNSYGENVSRETFDKLVLYVELLKKWQKKINLVSPKTIAEVWTRHIGDSAQLYPFMAQDIPSHTVIADFGSGAGFPGLVLSIMGYETIHLVESDQRKAVFLREVIRQCDLSATVHSVRIEALTLKDISCVTARALSSLSQLLDYTFPVLQTGGTCYFLKGESVDAEIETAKENWRFTVEKQASMTDERAVLLKISDIKKR